MDRRFFVIVVLIKIINDRKVNLISYLAAKTRDIDLIFGTGFQEEDEDLTEEFSEDKAEEPKTFGILVLDLI